MNSTTLLLTFLVTSTLAGLTGALVMTLVMRMIARAGGGGDMVEALGSLFTGSLDNARLVGRLLHMISAVGFAMLYAVLLVSLHLTAWPVGLFAGLGFGVFHGIVVSLSLVWIVAEMHPLQQYRTSTPTVFLAHVAGHVAFGTVVGLVVALSPLQ